MSESPTRLSFRFDVVLRNVASADAAHLQTPVTWSIIQSVRDGALQVRATRNDYEMHLDCVSLERTLRRDLIINRPRVSSNDCTDYRRIAEAPTRCRHRPRFFDDSQQQATMGRRCQCRLLPQDLGIINEPTSGDHYVRSRQVDVRRAQLRQIRSRWRNRCVRHSGGIFKAPTTPLS